MPDIRTLDFVYTSRKTALRGAHRAAEPGWVAGEPVRVDDGWKAVLVAETPVHPEIVEGQSETRSTAFAPVFLAVLWGRHKRPAVIEPCSEFIGDGTYAVGDADSPDEAILRRRKNGIVQMRGRSEHGFDNRKPIHGRVIGYLDAIDRTAVKRLTQGWYI